jgi:hypothetical protein
VISSTKKSNGSMRRNRRKPAVKREAEGKDPSAEKKAERGAGTFAELADSYAERRCTASGTRPVPPTSVCALAQGGQSRLSLPNVRKATV